MHRMNETEMAIANIKNLKAIDINFLMDNIMCIICFYEDKSLTLCELDKEYDFFVQKIIQVYNNEKNLPSNDFTSKIIMSPRTKELLITASNKIDKKLENSNNKTKYPLIYNNQKDFKLLSEFLLYHFNEILALTNLKAKKIAITGFNTKYAFHILLNDNEIVIPVNFNVLHDILTTQYTFKFNNLFGPVSFSQIELIINKNIVIVKSSCPKINTFIEKEYKIFENNLTITKNLYLNKKCVYHHIENKSNNNLPAFLQNLGISGNCFELPWHSFIVNQQDSDKDTITNSFKYIIPNQEHLKVITKSFSKIHKDKYYLNIAHEISENNYYKVGDKVLLTKQIFAYPISPTDYQNTTEKIYYYYFSSPENIENLKEPVTLKELDMTNVASEAEILNAPKLKLILERSE